MTLTIDGVVENVDVCNVIPAQQAGLIAHAAGHHRRGLGPGVGL
jgi:sulfide dehydrogenase [flavocytochrome c] flavoprotein subunit